MQLKKIDTESKTYKNVREAISFVSGAGAGLTVECMSIPWVKAIFKSRAMRIICLSGVVPMATMVSLLSKGTSDTIVDMYAESWNDIVDFVEGIKARNNDEEPDVSEVVQTPPVTLKQTYLGFDIPGYNATPTQEKEFIDNIVTATNAFAFPTEEKAKETIERLANFFEHSKADYVDILLYFSNVLDRNFPNEIYDICLKYGWTKDDIKDWGVDRINDDLYIADLNNYHDISGSYDIL